MLKRTKGAIDLWIVRAIARAKHAALTGETLGGVLRAVLARKSSPETTLAKLLTDFLQSLRTGQVKALVELLDIQQKFAFMEIANMATEVVAPHDTQPKPRDQSGPRSAVK